MPESRPLSPFSKEDLRAFCGVYNRSFSSHVSTNPNSTFHDSPSIYQAVIDVSRGEQDGGCLPRQHRVVLTLSRSQRTWYLGLEAAARQAMTGAVDSNYRFSALLLAGFFFASPTNAFTPSDIYCAVTGCLVSVFFWSRGTASPMSELI